jgi:alpha-L-fucosidase 2
MTLWYTRPAEHWIEALPIGNGRLGAMVFGGIAHERLALNEDTLWSGATRPWNNPHARELLPEVRRRIASGDYTEADRIARQMQGPYGESFQPLGDLLLEFPDQPVAGYRRELDLHSAIAAVCYRSGKTMVTREAFAGAPDRVVVVRLTADLPAQISLTARIDTPHPHRLESYDECTVLIHGAAPTHVAPDYFHVEQPVRYEEGGAALTFSVGLRIVADGGRLSGDGTTVHVQDADAITVLVAAATSFQGSTHDTETGVDPAARVVADLARAAAQPYATLRTAHIQDHTALFERVTLDLGYTDAASLPTDERIRAWTEHGDPHLAALLFQYGRYLLIASSRPGTQPATLQGIWNDQLRPPWSSNWTLNINTQMNYWPAEPANLAECHMPLFDLVSDLSRTGRETAETNYGCHGWVAHHNTDLWRRSVTTVTAIRSGLSGPWPAPGSAGISGSSISSAATCGSCGSVPIRSCTARQRSVSSGSLRIQTAS